MLSAAWTRFRTEWPAWLAALFVVGLPFRRNSEIPISLFALLLPFLLMRRENRVAVMPAVRFIVPVFLCFWIPMFLSSFDSFNAEKSWLQSLAGLRFPLTALGMALLLNKNELRWRFLQIVAFVLLFWAIDGYVQLAFGRDLFGIPMSENRLNALFYRRTQFYGPTLAFLSPLVLEYARRRWPAWAWASCLVLVLGAVMIAGMRAGWLAMGLVVLIYGLLMMRQENAALRRWALIIPSAAILMVMASYAGSEKVRERVSTTMVLSAGTVSALDEATSLRVPIFTTGFTMYKAHPVNGVGVRAFPRAYPHYAEPGDIWLGRDGPGLGANHAHNVILEVMADTGTIGLVLWIFGAVLVIRQWRRTPSTLKQDPFPFVFALALVLFPLNSHFSFYGVYTSSFVWWLFGLWGATLITRD